MAAFGASPKQSMSPAGLAGSPGGGCATAAGSRSSLAASPRTSRGSLARGYEGKFGGGLFQGEGGCASPRSPAAAATPRSGRKQGVTSFTDPMNPFARPSSKSMTKVEDVRADAGRAGSRTSNPGHIGLPGGPGAERERPATASKVDVRTPADGRSKLVVHCYGSHAWRPSKAMPSGAHAKPQSSDGAANLIHRKEGKTGESSGAPSARCSSSALENYLNDMKRTGLARRAVPSKPSNELLRMNNVLNQLPSERRAERARSLSIEPRSPCQWRGAESDGEDTYGFASKRSVSGSWSARSSRRDILHHESGSENVTLNTPRSARGMSIKADQRFEEMVAHIKNKTPASQAEGRALKANDRTTSGLLDNNSYLKYPVD